MSVKDQRGSFSLPLGKQREIRLGNDEDVIIIETDGELTSPDDDLPDISLQACSYGKNAKSATQKMGTPANKTMHDSSCKGTPSCAAQTVPKNRPGRLSKGLVNTPKVNKKHGERKQVDSMLKGVHHSSRQDVLVGSKSKSLPNTLHSSKQHSSRLVVEHQSKVPRVSKACSTLSSVTTQQHARKSMDCVDLFQQTAQGEQCNHERGNSLKSVGRREMADSKGRVVTAELIEHTGTYKKGLPGVRSVEGKGNQSDGDVIQDHEKIRKNAHSKPKTSDNRGTPVGNSLPAATPGSRNRPSKMYPLPSTPKQLNSHSVTSKHPPTSSARSKHQLKSPPNLPSVNPNHPLSSSIIQSSSPGPLPVSSKQSQNPPFASISTKTATTLPSKDSETESSSMFDFNENDLFEVLDSVESESICSAYNQSDSESLDTAGESKPTAESVQMQSSNLLRGATCKSPSESRVKDFSMSFMKKKQTRQVARKSTTLNGASCFRHPLKGRGFLRLKRHCTLHLSHIHYTSVQRAKEEMSKYPKKQKRTPVNGGKIVQAECGIEPTLPQESTSVALQKSTSVKSLGKKKSDSKYPESSTPSKRPKLLSDTEMLKPEKQPKTSHAFLTNPPQKMLKEGHHSNSPKPGSKLPPLPSMVMPQSRKPLPLILKRFKSKVLSSSTESGLRKHREHTQEKCVDNVTNATSTMPSSSTTEMNTAPGTPSEKPLNSSVTPQQRPTSTEPRSPVVKKCLSLKHNRAPSVSEGLSKCSFACSSPQPHSTDGAMAKKVDNNVADSDVPHVSCKAPDNPLPDRDNTAQPATEEEAVSTMNTAPQHVECRERSLSSSSENGLTKLSPRDEVYDLRLMETIAKLAPESEAHTEDDAVVLSPRYSVRH